MHKRPSVFKTLFSKKKRYASSFTSMMATSSAVEVAAKKKSVKKKNAGTKKKKTSVIVVPAAKQQSVVKKTDGSTISVSPSSTKKKNDEPSFSSNKSGSSAVLKASATSSTDKKFNIAGNNKMPIVQESPLGFEIDDGDAYDAEKKKDASISPKSVAGRPPRPKKKKTGPPKTSANHRIPCHSITGASSVRSSRSNKSKSSINGGGTTSRKGSPRSVSASTFDNNNDAASDCGSLWDDASRSSKASRLIL